MENSLETFISANRKTLQKGPIGLVFAEDNVEVASTTRHLLNAGFSTILVLGAQEVITLGAPDTGVHSIVCDVHSRGSVARAVNKVIAACPGKWIHYCYNAEYLFHPFCETRDITELLAFHAEERREAMLTTVLDLYARDLSLAPNGVAPKDAMFDQSGYYALRRFKGRRSEPMERQLDIFGGVRWRFEEHIPMRSRRVDRIGLFRAKPGLELRDNHTLNDEEMNTYACPWHHNLSAAIVSFRAAKALLHNPGSRNQIQDFKWAGSEPFTWTSTQLLELGFMEPGQWF